MNTAQIAEKLKKTFKDSITGESLDAIDPWVEVSPAALPKVALFCRDEPDLALDYLKDMTAVDWLITDAAKAKKIAVEPHLEVLYHLFSFKHRHDFKLKVLLPRWRDDQPGTLPQLASVASVWKIADWHEREIYDLMGIEFVGHPNLRRILCPEDWEGHPLRKDYVFPLEYQGIRCR